MATPSVSSVVNFVKKYPITLCGFSLLFMPSVHRLLLYFTPLLLSTAIFIVAMLSWGPSMSSNSERGKTRGRRNDWAFNGSLKIYEEDEEEEEEGDAEGEGEGEAEEGVSLNKGKKLEPKLQDPEEGVGTASYGAISSGQKDEPDPDLGGDDVGTASNGAISRGDAEPDPDFHGEGVGTASSGAQAEPDPDLHGDHVGAAGSAKPDVAGDCVGTASCDAPAAAQDVYHCEPDPDLHGEQHAEPAPAAQQLLYGAPDHHHCPHNPTEPAVTASGDQRAAGDHLEFHDAEPDHLNYHDAELNHVNDYDDEEANHLDYHDAEPDPDLHGEAAASAAGHAKSEGPAAHVENDDQLQAAIAELRQKLGVMKRAPYSTDDPRSQQLSESLQTLQAAA